MKGSGRALVATLAAMTVLTACGGNGGGDGGGGGSATTLTVWTVEDLSERVEAQKKILAAFTAKTGIKAELVAVGEDQLTPVLTAAAASNELPDVIGALSLGAVNRLLTDDLLDPDAAREVVESLGTDTFAPSALELTRKDEQQLSVPSDGWAQLLFYRKDLFQKAGLAPPETYETIQAAAAKLDQGQVAGIVAGTAPASSFTHQTFEQIALANGCQLVEGNNVALDSPKCVESFRFFSDLIRQHSVRGNQDDDTTRAAYFAGRASMLIWSSFLLDELAGLRDDALPTCPQCKTDRTFLAKNTGIVGAIKGPSGSEPATFGEIVSWAILRDAATEQAREFVKYMMSDGYEQWLAIAPEGKVPTRTGTQDKKDSYVTAWKAMPAGVDRKAPLTDFYPQDVLDTVGGSVERFTRWGFPQGKAELAGAVLGQNVIAGQVSSLVNSGEDPAEAARKADQQATTIDKEVGG
jgi:multiple sugar transport system substrate-binding protein